MEKVQFFTNNVPVEDQALKQIELLASLPFVKRVAVMPDVHVGVGACVGTVIATDGIVIPAAVGADVMCGMLAYRTSLYKDDALPFSDEIRADIEKNVPHGRSDNGRFRDVGKWLDVPSHVQEAWNPTPQPYLTTGFSLKDEYDTLCLKYPMLARNAPPVEHLGTLGTGNHFLEISYDETDRIWVIVHSGSRGVGARIGQVFTKMAKEATGDLVPNVDLAYLPKEDSDAYMVAMRWAGAYARTSRNLMATAAVSALYAYVPGGECDEYYRISQAIDCYHNFVQKERHFGQDFLVTRKGAVKAGVYDRAIIPGSMGAKTFLVTGKGNVGSLMSCSHGAGRKMSRTQARKTISLAEHEKATMEVNCSKDPSLIDESPGAYKDIDAVMKAQSELVEIQHVLKQIICVKGESEKQPVESSRQIF